MEIKRGNIVKDIVTGFIGTVTARVVYLNGCVQFCVVPVVDKKGTKMPEGEYIDQGRLEYVREGVKARDEEKPPGGDMRDCPPNNRLESPDK